MLCTQHSAKNYRTSDSWINDRALYARDDTDLLKMTTARDAYLSTRRSKELSARKGKLEWGWRSDQK